MENVSGICVVDTNKFNTATEAQPESVSTRTYTVFGLIEGSVVIFS